LSNWITPADAVEALARLHDLSGRYANYDVCVRAAEETILERLAEGQICTIASLIRFQVPSDSPFDPPTEFRNQGAPNSFWKNWAWSRIFDREVDWITGDFRYDYNKQYDDYDCWGKAFSVKFDRKCLPWIEDSMSGDKISPDKPLSAKRGRSLAEWWPDFVAELVAYTHNPGLPEGIGHQGQSQVINDIGERLAKHGKEEPSRTQVQETVNAVLRRMRSAGN